MFFADWKSKNLLNLNDTPHSWLSLPFKWFIWAWNLSRVSTWIPRYLKLSTSFIGSVPINNWGRFTTILLVTIINSGFAGFKDNLLRLRYSNISRNRLFTFSVSISKDVPTYTSTVSSAYSILSSLEHIRAKLLNSKSNCLLLQNLSNNSRKHI